MSKFFLYFHLRRSSLWGAAAAGGNSELALPFTRSPASLRSSSASSQTSSLKWMPPHTSSLSQDHNVNYSAMQVKLQYSQQCALFVVPKQCEQHLMLLCCVKALKQLWVGDESVNSKVQRRSCSVSNFNSHTKQQCNRNVSAYFTVFTSVETRQSFLLTVSANKPTWPAFVSFQTHRAQCLRSALYRVKASLDTLIF